MNSDDLYLPERLSSHALKSHHDLAQQSIDAAITLLRKPETSSLLNLHVPAHDGENIADIGGMHPVSAAASGYYASKMLGGDGSPAQTVEVFERFQPRVDTAIAQSAHAAQVLSPASDAMRSFARAVATLEKLETIPVDDRPVPRLSVKAILDKSVNVKPGELWFPESDTGQPAAPSGQEPPLPPPAGSIISRLLENPSPQGGQQGIVRDVLRADRDRKPER